MNEVIYISEGTAARRRVKLSLAVDDTDGITLETGWAAATAMLSANGGAGFASANNVTEIDVGDLPGSAYLELTTGELTTLGVGNHRVYFKPTGVAPMFADFAIIPDNPWVATPANPTLADGSITSATFAAGAINASAIGSDAITSAKVADNTITAGKIATGAISATKFAAGAIDAAAIATGAIDADAIAANAISDAKIASGAITSGKFAAGAINAAAIATDAISNAKIADGAISVGKIADGAISNTKIADNAISASKIASDAITAAKIATGAITNAKFAGGAIDASALSLDAVNEIRNAIQDFEPETGWSNTELSRLIAAVLLGKNTGNTFRDINDTKARVTATVVGANRTALVLDAS